MKYLVSYVRQIVSSAWLSRSILFDFTRHEFKVRSYFDLSFRDEFPTCDSRILSNLHKRSA